jgi:tetratricopeptide (TPR) repeat protein
MGRLLLKVSELALLMLFIVLSAPLSGEGLDFAEQQTDTKTATRTKDDAVKRSELMKPHFANGNQAMQDAKAIRQQLQTASSDQKPTLLARMKEEYQTAIQVAINTLEQAAMLKPVVGTYMELGTDLAQVGKMPEATAACDKILTVDPTAKNMQAGCYKNVAIVLTNKGKLLDAIAPLQKATLLNPQDALAWKLLGDSLSSTITSKSQDGKIVYVIPPGTLEAYQRCLQLDPNGPYAEQVKSALEGFAQLTKSPTETKEKN